LQCRNCGAELDDERIALGYDYCIRAECVDACFEPLDVVAVAVNKASDQYVLKRDLGWADPAPRREVRDEGGWLNGLSGPTRREPPKSAGPRSGAARVADLEARLEADLAREGDPVRRAKLVNDFNARLRRLDIRYRRTAQRRS
jgi:hypothetical protein